MNRRSFFKALLVAGAGFTILPPATTYQRIWRAQRVMPEGYVVEYHANSIGFRHILEQCGAVLDRRPATLAEEAFFNTVFQPHKVDGYRTHPTFWKR